jgi:hypothetical protein
MNCKTDKKDTLAILKELVTRKGVDAPRVTADSGLERRWYPPFIVRE